MYMEEVTLNNGRKIPKIGLGMWDTYDEEAAQAVATALQLGYRRIDTAMFYKNEPEVWSPLGRGDDLNHPVIQKIAEKYNKTTAQIILRWHLQRGVTMIPKSVKKHRMLENTDVFDFALTEEEMKQILAQETGVPRGGYRDEYTWE